MKKHYDVVVMGSGAGLTIADYAAKNGYRTAVIEKGPFGGTCVNRGCIPSKMLIYPSDLMRTISTGRKVNIEAESVTGHFSPLVQRVTDTVDTLAEKIQKHYERSDKIDVYRESGTFIEEGVIQSGQSLISGDRIYLAIGARPKIPEINGLAGTPYLTSDEALRLKRQPEKALIIGGGFVSAELAHFYSSMGTEVEVFSRSGFLKHIDKDVRKVFLEECRKSQTVHEFASVNSVSYNEQQFSVQFSDQNNNQKTAKGDALIIAVGRQPWTDKIGIENTSIQTTAAGFIQVDEYLKTHDRNIWALGDCIGRHLFRHMANFEARYLISQLLENDNAPISYPPIPFAVFAHPQIGVVGKTKQQLEKEEVKVITGISEYKKSDMGKARKSAYGLVKLIFDQETEKLLSAHIIGDEAATMIHILIAYIQMEARVKDLIDSVFIHPALPEVISSAAHDAKNKY